MAKQKEHERLIAIAAKAVLEPLGCKRKGQSRLWYSDQGYWLISIEFQPSNWTKGSYLNMGVRWLWSSARGVDISYRPIDFVPFESVEQFAPLIDVIAARAVDEVSVLRQQFDSLDKVHRHLVANATREGWPIYNAAIASGLVGDVTIARQLFNQIESWPTYGYEWEQKLKADSAELSALLDEPRDFSKAITSRIEQRREAFGLSPDWVSLSVAGSTTSQ